jgi:2-polyprenyl-6-methoxyphenol hydroxylase-like FAD-dependent oxidoreductase
MPPKLGLGVNTAIQSAQNLAWKLAGRAATPLGADNIFRRYRT